MSLFKRPCQFLAINAHKMAPRTTQWLQERRWDAPTKGLTWRQREQARGQSRLLKHMASVQNHLGVELGANLKSISHRCHLFEVAFVWELTKETIHLPLGCLQGGSWQGIDTREKYEPPSSARRSKNNTGFLARPQSGELIVCTPKVDRCVTQKQGNRLVFSSFGEDQITMPAIFFAKVDSPQSCQLQNSPLPMGNAVSKVDILRGRV